MAVGQGIGSVAVGLGKKPNPSANMLAASGGTAVVWHDASDYLSLLSLRGQTLPTWTAVYTPTTPDQTSAFSVTSSNLGGLTAGATVVTFSRATVVDVTRNGNIVEVTLQCGSASVVPGPCCQTAITKSVSNIRNN